MFYTEMNGITTTFSPIAYGKYGEESIAVRFEKTVENGFASGELILPDCFWTKQVGFTEDDIFYLEKYGNTNIKVGQNTVS